MVKMSGIYAPETASVSAARWDVGKAFCVAKKKHMAYRKKYKPCILKYKALILKYMPYIFRNYKYL